MQPSPQVLAFVAFAERIANGPYRYYAGGDRCNPLASGLSDCSGLVVASARAAGVTIDCTGSFSLAQRCHAAHTGVSLDVARATRGALLFKGINEGQGGRPGIDSGHVAISEGDGTTVEARNSRAGILFGPFDGRGWDYAGLPPWFPMTVAGPLPAPPSPKVDPGSGGSNMIFQPGRGAPLREGVIFLDEPTHSLWCLNGARLEGAVHWGDGYVLDVPTSGVRARGIFRASTDKKYKGDAGPVRYANYNGVLVVDEKGHEFGYPFV